MFWAPKTYVKTNGQLYAQKLCLSKPVLMNERPVDKNSHFSRLK